MKNFNKAFDHYRKLYRGGDMHVSIVNGDDCYWLTDGYSAHRIPAKEMELNPAIFKPCIPDLMEIVTKAESGVTLNNSGLIQPKKKFGYDLVPFTSESKKPFTIWFKKAFLDTFPVGITLIGNSPISPAAVQDCGKTIGIILPCRNEKDISLFI